MKRIYCFLLSSLLGLPAMAQTALYKGVVRDAEGMPLELVNIAALQLPDSTLVGGTITNSEGTFSLSLSAERESLLFRVSALGFSTKFLLPDELDSITLEDDYIKVSAVMVSGRQKIYQLKDDKVVCNVSGTSLATESNINDIIGKLPGFFLQGDKLMSLQRGGIEYYINGRQAALEEVNRLTPASIKTIEIDRHPGARVSGEVGTVVYIYTHSLIDGFSAYIHSYTRANHRFTQAVDGEMRYKYKNFSVTLGADVGMYSMKSQQENTFELLDSPDKWKVTSRDTKEKNTDINQSYFLALAYSPSENHHLHARYTYAPSSGEAVMVGDLSLQKGTETMREEFVTTYNSKGEEHAVNFNYSGQLGKGFALDVASDWYQQRLQYSLEANEKIRTTLSSTNAHNTLVGFSPRFSYSANRFRVELGGDINFSSVKGLTELNIDDVPTTDNKIQELKGAGFLSGGWTSPNEQWQLYAGVRYEANSKEYFNYMVSTQPERFLYHTILPSLSVSFSTGQWHHQVAYRPSVAYPAFSQLSGGESYINRYTLKRSNPDLVRSVTHQVNYSVAYSWLYFSAGYNYTFDPISETFLLEPFKRDYRAVVYPKNLDPMQGVEIILNAAPIFNFYEPRYMVGYIQSFMTLHEEPDGPRTVSTPLVIVSINNGFSLPHDWGLSLDYTYKSPGSSAFVEYSRTHSLNASVKKYFFNRSLRISLNGVDLLAMASPRIYGSYHGVQINSFSYMDSRSVRLHISWYFQRYESHETRSSISSEIDRL